jgi:hypothetical protein
MRFVSDLYEHPDLTDSEVWDKDANNRSGGARVVAVMGLLSLATVASIVAAIQYVGYERLSKAAGMDNKSVVCLSFLLLFKVPVPFP